MTSRIGIVGGGALGMTLALRMREQGHDVVVLEGARAAGGLASSQQIGGYTWDRFYHVILQSDRDLLALLRDLGVDEPQWGVTRTGFYTDGVLYSLSTSLEFLAFPPLSLFDKMRLAATIVYASRVKDWRPLEKIPVSDWLRKLSGKRTFERIWLPLLKSKLGENYRIASAAFIWAIIARMYAARRSGLKREQFGYVKGGYATVLARFERYLDEKGIELRTGAPVTAVRDSGSEVEVIFVDGTSEHFDRVILTLPANRIPELVPQLARAERERLERVVYQGVLCASLLTKKPLASYYVTNITDGWVPFTGVIEMTTLVDKQQFGGNSLVYLPRYLAQDDSFWQASDDEVRSTFLAALERMYPNFRRDDVIDFRVARARDVLAISTLDYSATTLPAMRTSLANVFIVNSAQIESGTLNLNETVGLANRQAAALAPMLNSREAEAVHV
ncbi:MAG TPA: NAD(P)/FAD-dependent oxidoreductase [Gemmatimonadaceae bacterium]|jgi:protoporphyrinogen oxidase|nr:NAD(P)/FAD-dependent oxidoreductase [Gemmatimonadaceae bacterium]